MGTFEDKQMYNGDKSPKEIEELSKAIINAIMNSEKVKRSLLNLHRQSLMSPESFLALILKMQDLIEVVERSDKKRPRKSNNTETQSWPQIIDGQKMDPKEIAFLHYCQEKFDEKEWLKKLRLFLDDNS